MYDDDDSCVVLEEVSRAMESAGISAGAFQSLLIHF